MKPQMHFRDAAAWMAKAPPFPAQLMREASTGIVLRFPIERADRQKKGTADARP